MNGVPSGRIRMVGIVIVSCYVFPPRARQIDGKFSQPARVFVPERGARRYVGKIVRKTVKG
jgi:hypothetical protein